MHPILFNLGPIPIHTYGVMIAIGFLLTTWFAKREAIRVGIPGDKLVDLAFWGLLVGVLGCRLLYVLTQLPFFFENPLHVFYIWEGGLVFWGGPLLNIPLFVWYTKKYGMDRWKSLDVGAGAIPLAHAFGRIGCISAGCCYGKPTHSEWGIKLYSELVDQSLRGINIHPTQLYEAAALFIFWLFLRWLRFRVKFDGQIMFAYLIGYSIIRSIIEEFRGDLVRGFVIEDVLSTSQFISLITVIICSFFYYRRSKQASQKI